MNFHGGPGGSYPPIAFDSKTGSLEVRPLFYGLYLFSHLVANDLQWRNVSMSGTMPPGPTPAPVTPGTDPFRAHFGFNHTYKTFFAFKFADMAEIQTFL